MKSSLQSIRLTGVPIGRTETQIQEEAQTDAARTHTPLAASIGHFFSKGTENAPSPSRVVLQISLATQKDRQTATITFATKKHKSRAHQSSLKRRKRTGEGAYIDDTFRGITVLFSGVVYQNVDLESVLFRYYLHSTDDLSSICAVHGLGGHAFDTWMGYTKMWLRDHLPKHPQFQNSRIMTYGYDSVLRNKEGMQSRLSDFADQLLIFLGQHRTTQEERARPVLFICHSMGGLVARLAMVRYEKYPQLRPGVVLGPCGLLLLSTPNAGSMAAQWSELAVALAGTLAGVRRNLINELKVLNPSHVDSVNDWKTLQHRPLIRCYHESSPTASKAGATQV
jgi:triacylglycerol esterase/lipase EstA (alpha/beta hydrolase family)